MRLSCVQASSMRRELLLLFVLARVHAAAPPADAIGTLFQWIRDLGGEVNVEVRANNDGVRGGFLTKDIPIHGGIAAIPAATLINAGSYNDSFAMPILTILREMKDPYSRFGPYLNALPGPDGVVNACNMDVKYAPMWKNAYWEKDLLDWREHLARMLEGKLDSELEYTLKEMVGNATVTLDDLKYACAVTSTRYVASTRRRRMLLAPVFDLANHERHCDTYLSTYDSGDFLFFLAGRPMKAGEEVCYSYGDLRDDYAVSHYGFLPRLEDPPRMWLVDLPDWNPDVPFDHDDPIGETPFHGEPEALRAEMERLTAIHRTVRETPDTLPPSPPGEDYVYDMMKEAERRRLAALEYEIRRLAGLLDVKAEL